MISASLRQKALKALAAPFESRVRVSGVPLSRMLTSDVSTMFQSTQHFPKRDMKLLLFFFLGLAVGYANAAPPESLFEEATNLPAIPAPVRVSRMTGKSIELRSRLLRFNPHALPGRAGEHSRLNLFTNRTLDVEWQHFNRHAEQNLHWTGRLADDPLSAVDLTQVDGIMHVQVVSPVAGDFEVQMQPDGSYAVREFNADAIRGNGGCFLRTTNAEYGVSGDPITNGIT